jgi:hypothetical protein
MDRSVRRLTTSARSSFRKGEPVSLLNHRLALRPHLRRLGGQDVLVPERPASIGLRSFGSQHDDHPAPPAQGKLCSEWRRSAEATTSCRKTS